MHEALHVAKLALETAAAIGGLILVGGVLLVLALAFTKGNPFQ